MSTRVLDRVEEWTGRPFADGYRGLQGLTDQGFSGVVRAGNLDLFMTRGVAVAVHGGDIEAFEGVSGTAYEAPSPALPLLAVMQERSEEVRDRFYTEQTPLSTVDETLSEGGFTGYIELSENVLSGDYYLVYHAGKSMSVAFVGQSEQLVDGREAFETADDEVGIYQVRPVDIEPVELPDPGPKAPADSDVRDEQTPAETNGDDSATEADETDGADSTAETVEGGSTPADAEVDDTGPDGPATGGDHTASADPAGEGSKQEPAAPGAAETDTHRAGDSTGSPADSVDGEDSPEERSADPVETGETATATGAGDTVHTTDSELRLIPSVTPGRTVEHRRPDPDHSPDAPATSDQSPEGDTADDSREESSESRSARESETDTDDDADDETASADRSREHEPDDPDETPQTVREEQDDLRAELDAVSEERDDLRAELDAVSEERDDLRAEIETLRREREDLRAELDAVSEEREDLRAELDAVTEEREDLRAEIETLRKERDDLRAELDTVIEERDELEGQSRSVVRESDDAATPPGGETDAGDETGRELTPEDALTETVVFVRYRSQGDVTLKDAHAGRGDQQSLQENLKLELYSGFEGPITVDGRSHERFVERTLAYHFLDWVVTELPFEIRETGNRKTIQGLYDALPTVDHADLQGVVDLNGEPEPFDIVFRDQRERPLLVATIARSRKPVTGDQMEQLVTAAERVGQAEDSLQGAFVVTRSYFDGEALEIADEATQSSLLSRDKQKSFVSLSRKQGFHLCLVEAREGSPHLAVPEL